MASTQEATAARESGETTAPAASPPTYTKPLMDPKVQATNIYWHYDHVSDADLIRRVHGYEKPLYRHIGTPQGEIASEIERLGLAYVPDGHYAFVYKPGATLADYWDVDVARQMYTDAGVEPPPMEFFTKTVCW